MGALLSLLTFLVPNSKLVPRIHYGDRVAYVNVKEREPPSVLPTDDDHIMLNRTADSRPEAKSTRNSSGKEKTKKMTLSQLVEERVPSLHRPYRPSWWLPTGHVQTAYCVMADFSRIDPITYIRTLLRVPDGGTIGLDFTPTTPAQDQDPTAPVIVVLHGLTGGSQEAYVRTILHSACMPRSEGGLGARAVVVNSRGCAGVPLTSPQFYSAGHTDDIRSALLYLSAVYPRAPMLGVGFSLGANVMTRYIGEEGAKSRLKAAVVLACPWDLTANSRQLEGRFVNREFYSKALAQNLLALLRKNLEFFKDFKPSLLQDQFEDLWALKKPRLKDVDDRFVCYGGGNYPPFPFPNSDAYYIWASSHLKLPNVAVPLLAINAEDDPIVAEIPYAIASKNPWVVLATTKFGGHLGWFEGNFTGRKGNPPNRWYKKPVLEWFAAMLDVVDELGVKGVEEGNRRETRDGFEIEPENRFVGYKVVKTGLEIRAGTSDLLQGL